MEKSKLKILVVEEQSSVRAIMKSQLRHMGYSQICEASDGISALEILKEMKISLVISDWNMPLMNGYELLETIREDRELRHLPVIFLSALDDMKNLLDATEIATIFLEGRTNLALDGGLDQADALEIRQGAGF